MPCRLKTKRSKRTTNNTLWYTASAPNRPKKLEYIFTLQHQIMQWLRKTTTVSKTWHWVTLFGLTEVSHSQNHKYGSVSWSQKGGENEVNMEYRCVSMPRITYHLSFSLEWLGVTENIVESCEYKTDPISLENIVDPFASHHLTCVAMLHQ